LQVPGGECGAIGPQIENGGLADPVAELIRGDARGVGSLPSGSSAGPSLLSRFMRAK
jgi:hypothetical protein